MSMVRISPAAMSESMKHVPENRAAAAVVVVAAEAAVDTAAAAVVAAATAVVAAAEEAETETGTKDERENGIRPIQKRVRTSRLACPFFVPSPGWTGLPPRPHFDTPLFRSLPERLRMKLPSNDSAK